MNCNTPYLNLRFQLFVLAYLVMILSARSQDITTEGRDFWFGFMENNASLAQPVELKVYISAVDSTGGKIEIPGTNWSKDFSVLSNSTTMIVIPTNLGMALGSGSKENKGIHITAGANITVYALNSRQVSADASVILPMPALGKTYYISSYLGTPPSMFSEFLIVSAEDNTEVEITPVASTNDGHVAGLPYKVTLALGQVMQVQSRSDLTGTKVTASGSCKNFAVFSGNKWTNVGECGPAQDHLYEQLFPVSTWGKIYATVPYRGRLGGDVFKIVASENTTTVTISGQAPVLLDKGNSITKLLASPGTITADKPIQVAQLSRSQSCDNQFGDPFMIMLSPLEQSLTDITFNAFNITVIQNYYTNIISPTAAINELRLDGVSIANQFFPFADNPTYSYAQVSILNGNHTIISASGFSAFVYGFGNIESFGYATGAKLDNLNMTISSSKKSSGQITTTICAGDTVLFDVSSKRYFSKFQWNYNNTSKTGTQAEYIFPDGGTYFVSVTGSNDTGICSDAETATIKIKVIEPNEKIKGPSSVCPFDSGVSYFVNADPGNTYKWFIDGGVIADTPSKDNIIINWGGTNNNARVRLLTTDKMGCVGDTTALPVKVNIKLEPILPIGTDSLCSSDVRNNPYYVYKNPTSIYTWNVENGQIDSGQGTNEINISWNGPGLAKVSYIEESTVNTICAGKSDTLKIFIEQEPKEPLSIVLPKNIFQIGEPIQFHFNGDPLFKFKSWDFANGTTADSLKRESPIEYSYTCPGNYNIKVTAYTGTVCKNLGIGEEPIEILKPELSLLVVSHHIAKDSALEISTQVKNVDYLSGNVNLQRRTIDPTISSWSVRIKNQRNGQYTDTDLATKSNVYEYKLIIPSWCGNVYESLPHNSILLLAEKDSTEDEEKVNLFRNDYNNWKNGVDRYELWQQVDGSTFVPITDFVNNSLTLSYNNEGFRYCFKTRAVEVGEGNVSWSNTTCIDFVPKVTLHNVITANADSKNDLFIIEGLQNYPNSQLTIFNRYGTPVFESNNYRNDWGGTDNNGKELSAGVYFYLLNLNDDRPKEKIIKGTVSILH